ncbi:dehydrogenase/reductase SDR family member 7 isoform X2 [Neocloeon triangulifer]|uniref:dehydrogenase/reductase SDR family member 7 isoform X2 n=1 Tax=Neocloeon triangulifer TaxID=2078957 RepID=UPI00286ED08D|nr:dehydrogenase/reductase SDR family member 7 isoform X2 [Neocloeon triangulifer]
MGFFAFIGVIVILYWIVYVISLCLLDCDLRLKAAEMFGKKIGAVKGKVVWIVGASSGIGENLAIWLAKGGAKLVLSSRRRVELERVKEACLANSSLQSQDILVYPMDVQQVENHRFHLNEVLRHFGNLDILVNNAGRSQRAAWEEVDPIVDRQVFELNVFSIVSLSRVVVNYFSQRNPNLEGHLVVTSSIAGLVGAPFSPSYTGSKHALHGYFESLRSEKLGSKLKVTMLCPGPVYTGFLAESFTAVPGEKFNQSAETTDTRMTPDRCGQLCAIAIANELYEGWMALFPVLPVVYLVLYLPNLARLIFGFLGPRRLQKLRDSKETVPSPKENSTVS